jgi:hypothetical protein
MSKPDHPGLTSFWEGYCSNAPDVGVINRLAASLRSNRELSAVENSGLDVERAASLLGCRLRTFIIESRDTSHSASLVPRARGEFPFEILYNSAESWRRQRFSIAHELGHTFFYDRSARPARRLPQRVSVREEQFCDVFAGELLAPAAAIPSSPSLEDVIRLADELTVSQQVIARQMLRHGRFGWQAILFLSRPEQRVDGRDELRVRWSVAKHGHHVPKTTSYLQGPAFDAWRDQTPSLGRSSFEMGSLRGIITQLAIPCSTGVLVGVTALDSERDKLPSSILRPDAERAPSLASVTDNLSHSEQRAN